MKDFFKAAAIGLLFGLLFGTLVYYRHIFYPRYAVGQCVEREQDILKIVDKSIFKYSIKFVDGQGSGNSFNINISFIDEEFSPINCPGE